MTSDAFLTIDEQPISVGQVLRYLQANRKLDTFIGDIVRQFVIERELQTQTELGVSPAIVEQAIIDFRLQNQLTDANQFQEWLSGNGLTYEAFHNQVGMSFKLKKLKEEMTAPKLQEYFIERKVFLDRVVLSRIIVEDKELADELHSQIQEGAKFEQLAKEYSITDDKIMNGMVGPVSRGSMPDMLRAAVDLANPGDVVGPLGLEGRWGLFRVEAVLPSSLDDLQLRQSLQDELFEQWLAERMQQLPIKLQVGA
ncbi:MAG: peptidylprolyl isomerase [Cyanobacteria bacterium CRU_2_1]|nr:peptidylprolyl isomerase [Cyanobacteria bacterium RU_5_0]NJR57780.1 peptidylprolyl isomerase [Cyanobacteria bacterium CRU_2_1]